MVPRATELYRLTATEAVRLLKSSKVSPLELVDASVARIEATDAALNALPTVCIDRARAHARRIMKEGRMAKRPAGWLGGLPISVKDLNAVAGVRTTWGSPIFADHIPARSDIMVETLERNGAIVIGKSNTPEFGAGASTFNEVFGKTRNPWNTAKSVAGSSGGAGASVASGQVWLATGSDLGGSLRIPASFNGVIGIRPSPGRVARGPVAQPFDTLAVEGPIARTAEDAALFLDAMVGMYREDPISLAAPPVPFAKAIQQAPKFKRVGFSRDLGITPVDREVAEICEKAAQTFADAGAVVEHAAPDFSEARQCFQTLRAIWFANQMADHYRDRRNQLKPEIVWNIEKGLALTAQDIGRAEVQRFRLFRNVIEYFESYDLLLCPAAIVAPFDVDVRYVSEIDGHRFDNYIDWISITSAITLTSCPAVSAPAGFTRDGLPVGLQIVGPPRSEAAVLAAAAMLDESTHISKMLPIDPKSSISG